MTSRFIIKQQLNASFNWTDEHRRSKFPSPIEVPATLLCNDIEIEKSKSG